MTKRRDVVKLLKKNGFKNTGGANHDMFEKDGYKTSVPRHKKINENTFNTIKKQAGLK